MTKMALSTLVAGVIYLVLASSCLAIHNTNTTESSAQNACMIKHMMKYYTSSDRLTVGNMEHMFDAVTSGYHDRAPAHSEGTIPVSTTSYSICQNDFFSRLNLELWILPSLTAHPVTLL